MPYRASSLLTCVLSLTVGGGAVAQEAPTLGLVHNTVEMRSITYDCSRSGGGPLTCSLVWAAIRPKATISDLPAAIGRAQREFRAMTPFALEECKFSKDFLDIAEGRKAAPNPDAAAVLTEVQRQDAKRFAFSLHALCSAPTEEAYLAVARVSHERERRTCLVSANSYKRTFRPAQDARGTVTVWVAEAKPEGQCGVVDLSRFEQDPQGGTFKPWKFIARKAITNPAAELAPGARCGSFDEKPYLYDWRSKEHQLTCDYVEFSPL